MNSQAYPLQWPKGWPRTESQQREGSRFGKKTLSSALSFLRHEIELMGGTALVLSSNCALGEENARDPGVVAYFRLNETAIAVPCDRWVRVVDNVHAIGLTIEAMRGMERWGAKHMISAMFSGFKALPENATGPDPWELLGIPRNANEDTIKAAFRSKSKIFHPDVPGTGDAVKFAEIRAAHDLAQQTAKIH